MRKAHFSVALVTALATLRCASEDAEEEPTQPFAQVVGPALPEWAVGSFSRHDIDVFYVRVAPDGTAFMNHAGGDYGGQSCGHAAVEAEEVVLTLGTTRHLLRQDARGRIFLRGAPTGGDDAKDLAYERAALCGRSVGGCGGYDRVEPCNAEEIAAYDALLSDCRASGEGDAGRDASID